tara:strand:- start:4740 stop:5198 length:459 start_codon:yes stop_codon:yes gene_type:complete
MKFFFLATILVVFFNTSYSQNNEGFFGEKFSITELEEYVSVRENIYNKSNYNVKIEGEILSSCPMKGCWMKIRAEKDTILVRFKDYGFFVPKAGIEGDKAIINGKMSIETLSVDLLRHYAEDAGKSKDEIEKITKPEVSLTFLADGVFIENL